MHLATLCLQKNRSYYIYFLLLLILVGICTFALLFSIADMQFPAKDGFQTKIAEIL